MKNIFFSGVRDFYRCVTSTITKKFSFKDTILEDVSFLLPENQRSLAAAAVLHLIACFPHMKKLSEIFCLSYKVAPFHAEYRYRKNVLERLI